MKPHLNIRAARACAALGAIGVTAAATTATAHATPSGLEWAQRAPGNGELTFLRLLEAGTTPEQRHLRQANPAAKLIRRMIAAGNRIATLPYVWGGGHGSFTASGYDCSGSVSFVLHAAGLLSTPEDSGQLESYGVPGRGRYVTIYANGGHAWMTIGRRRFDTIAFQETGTRWSRTIGSTAGYVAVHPKGL